MILGRQNLLVFVFSLVVGCGVGSVTGPSEDSADSAGSASVDASIGSTGGTLETKSGVLLKVPAGALQGSTVLSLDEGEKAPGSLPAYLDSMGPVIQLSPAGSRFVPALELTVSYAQDGMTEAGLEEALVGVHYIQSGGVEEALALRRDFSANTVTVALPHFSYVSATRFALKAVADGRLTDKTAIRTLDTELTGRVSERGLSSSDRLLLTKYRDAVDVALGRTDPSNPDPCEENNGGCGLYSTCINVSGRAGCEDIDECVTNNGGCGSYSTCKNQPNAPRTCEDVDECATNNGECGQYATCKNNSNAPPTCEDIDECATNNGGCDVGLTCQNNRNAPPSCITIVDCAVDNGGCGDHSKCVETARGPTCQDIDECITNNGGCGSYSTCKNQPNAARTCEDIDECAINNGGCGDYATCKNNSKSAPTCEDIDECATNNGGCGDYATCKNNSNAAPTCEDIDECTTNNGGCGDYATCKNNSNAARTCEDIDECETNNGGCGDYATCKNNSNAPPTCEDIDECETNNGGCGNYATCRNNKNAPPTCESDKTIQILFPSEGAFLGSTDAFAVKGRLEDLQDGVTSSDVLSLKVNGVTATLDVNDPSLWRAEVPLVLGATQSITATWTSPHGTHTARHTIHNREPIALIRAMDLHDDETLWVMDSQFDRHVLIAIDLNTNVHTVVSSRSVGSGPSFEIPTAAMAVNPTGTKVIVGDKSRILEVDVETGNRRVIVEGLHSQRDIAIDSVGETAYLLNWSELIHIDLVTGTWRVVSDETLGSGPEFRSAQALVLSQDENRAFVIDATVDAVFSVDLASGDRVIIADQSTGAEFSIPSSISLHPYRDSVVVSDNGRRSISSIDLATGAQELISDRRTGSGAPIVQAKSIVSNFATSTVLLATQGTVLQIDLSNGDRTPVVPTATVGVGTTFGVPTSLALRPLGSTALMTTKGRLFQVDLDSGDRTVVPDIRGGTAVAISRDNSVYLATGNSLLEIDTNSGKSTTVSSGSVGVGPNLEDPSSIAIDALGSVFATNSSALIRIDLATGDRTIVSDKDTGTGTRLRNPIAVGVDAVSATAYLIDSCEYVDCILAVDLSSGNRRTVSIASLYFEVGAGPNFGPIESMALELEQDRAFVANFDTLFSVDLSTGNRSIISGPINGRGPIPVRISSISISDSTAFVADHQLRALFSIDLPSGDRALISR